MADWVDRLLTVLECVMVLTVVIVIFVVLGFGAYWVGIGSSEVRPSRIAAAVRLANENWKVGLLLLIPLFYRPIRTFLEEVQEAWGMKRRPLRPSEQPSENVNP